MPKIELSAVQRQELLKLHRQEKNKRGADRIKTILLLSEGYSQKQVSETLLLDQDTVGSYKSRYLSGRADWYPDSYRGYVGKLSYTSIARLRTHTDIFKVSSAGELGDYLRKGLSTVYTASGVRRLAHRVGLSFKRLHRLPGGCDAGAQAEFIQSLSRRLATLTERQTVCFIDAVHPLHNSTCDRIWAKKGHIRHTRSNTGRRRVNINGAYNPLRQDFIYRIDPTVNAESTIGLLRQVIAQYPGMDTIFAYADNAGANRSKAVKDFPKLNPKIRLIHLPPYSPNLNLIERLWKFLRERVIAHRFYETFDEFERAIVGFCKNIHLYREQLKQRITLKFQTFHNIHC